MIIPGNDLEALKMVADSGKWLITIETGAIAVLGGWVTKEPHAHRGAVRLLVTAALGSFVCSIAAAAFLLLSLPEIAQTLPASTSIWLTSDSVVGRFANLQDLMIAEAFFFGVGVVCFAVSIGAVMWQPPAQLGTGAHPAMRESMAVAPERADERING